ncbi:hypothetical protein IAU60_005649 [Kwoniella sp. DSM 27419]
MAATMSTSSPPLATAQDSAPHRSSQQFASITLSAPLSTDAVSTADQALAIPPSYQSQPGSGPAGDAPTGINAQEEKQALRDSRPEARRVEGPSSPGASPSKRHSKHKVPPRTSSINDVFTSATDSAQTDEEGRDQPDLGIDTLAEGSQAGPQLGRRGYLPQGLDVRDALAQCEDPTLGWSLQFWVTIADPLTQHVFFACPASGQCSWDPPIGAFVVPRSPDGEWWELADTTRGNRSYYYNTLTGKTQWTRPGGNAFVIPLGLIQQNALPSRSSNDHGDPHTPGQERRRSKHGHTVSPITPTSDAPLRSGIPRPPHSPSPYGEKGIPRPLHSPSKSARSSSLSPSSSYGADQTLEAIVLEHFGSPSTYQSHARDKPTSPAKSTLSIPASGSGHTANTDSTLAEHGVSDSAPAPTPPAGSRQHRKRLTIVEEGSGHETDLSEVLATPDAGLAMGSPSWWERRKSQALTVTVQALSPKRLTRTMSSAPSSPMDRTSGGLTAGSQRRVNNKPITPILSRNPSAYGTNGATTGQQTPLRYGVTSEEPEPALPTDLPAGPIWVDSAGSVKTKRLSTGLHPLLPSAISSDIQAFQADDFARKYFAVKRSGVLRQRIPVERLMTWQKSPLSSPLLVISRHLQKDAVTTFKVIQHVMGERDRPVEGAKPLMSSSSHLSLSSLALGGRKGDEGHPQRGGRLANGFDKDQGLSDGEESAGKSDKMQVLEEIRWMNQLCVGSREMRDEVYCQLVKQLMGNPNSDAVVLGFQLFCVLCNAFGPNKNIDPFVRNFLKGNATKAEDGIGIMATYCLAKLEAMSVKGARGKVLTVGEIEHASDAAFYPSVYGESLDRIMELQKRAYPSLRIPVILPFLSDAILALGGLESEGIFRVPGDGDSVAELKSRMDRGHYQLKGIDDPHVAASLFKLWLRELEAPIVPTALYNDALIASRSAAESIDFVQRLPAHNRRVLLFVVSFAQLFKGQEVVDKTKMTPANLALVLAPNILRTTSNSLVTVFTNSTFESKFLFNLLEHMDPREVDPEYAPSHGQAVGRV